MVSSDSIRLSLKSTPRLGPEDGSSSAVESSLTSSAAVKDSGGERVPDCGMGIWRSDSARSSMLVTEDLVEGKATDGDGEGKECTGWGKSDVVIMVFVSILLFASNSEVSISYVLRIEPLILSLSSVLFNLFLFH